MKMFIMVGAPGSGKSTKARLVALEHNAIICSADDYFVGLDGIYRFDFRLLKNAHQSCFDKAKKSISTSNVVIDNTNTTLKDRSQYIELAKKSNAELFFVEPDTDWRYNADECFKKNVHGVPLDVIQRMISNIKQSKGKYE